MACDISKVLENFNNIIDVSIKGNAASISQDSEGHFHVKWGDEYMVKTKEQAFRMADKKVKTTLGKLEQEGYSQNFGPYLYVDNSLSNEIVINKLAPKRLERALELRNQAEEQQKLVEEIMTEKDKEFFQQQLDDMAILSAQNDNQQELSSSIDEAMEYVDKLDGISQIMMRDKPSEYLKFIAEQYWNMRNTRLKGKFEFTPGSGLDSIPDEIMEIAKKLYPESVYIKPDDAPPINPEC